MAMMREVRIGAEPLSVFDPYLSDEQRARVRRAILETRERMAGRVLWNINSTARGGGVAEMLQSLLGYARGEGIDTRWLVLEGHDAFFRITKRLHHALHGTQGDGSPLGDAERAIYEDVARDNFEEFLTVFSPDDLVIAHDPQTAGLIPLIAHVGAVAIWRCHIGTDDRNEEVELGWRFLLPYLEAARAVEFSRAAFVPPELQAKSVVIPPSIDIFSAKNESIRETAVKAILAHTGLVEGPVEQDDRSFRRGDGTPGRVDRKADIIQLGPPPTFDVPLVVQVSRWDPLKDPVGVMRGFVEFLRQGTASQAHLILAGPSVHSVADDPEAAATFNEVEARWRALPHTHRARIHLASLPMSDVEENAIIVNALQRHATVVVQKSLQEGFGLTVTEAMWKGRPVIASAVGGIQDQVRDGIDGLLIRDPRDPAEFARALRRMLEDPQFARACGERARERARERFLGVRQLLDHAAVFGTLLKERGAPARAPSTAAAMLEAQP